MASDPPRVFLSYSHDSPGHMDRVLELADRLRQEGVDAQLDQYEVSPPEGWPRWSIQQVEVADFVLAVCTESYRQRFVGKAPAGVGRGVKWEGEYIGQILYDSEGSNKKFVAVVFDEADEAHIPRILRGGTRYNVSSKEGYESLYRHLTGQRWIVKPELGGLNKLSQRVRRQDFVTDPIWVVPHRANPYFTGREEVLKALHRALRGEKAAALSQPHAITGLGGIGKTQTAIEFAYRYRSEYQGVLWARAGAEAELKADFVEIGQALNLPVKNAHDQEETVQGVQRWMEQNPSWLLVLDNADQPEIVAPFLPANPRGDILLTSRAQDFSSLGVSQHIRLETFPREESLSFLLKRAERPNPSPGERAAAEELAEELGHLALALEQAGAYIFEKRSRFQDYLASYRRQRLKILSRSRPKASEYPESVATTWAVNFRAAEEASEGAAEILRASAFLAPDHIPLELFTEGARELGPVLSQALANAVEDPLQADEILGPLIRYSLIEKNVEEKMYSVHRLVQEVVKDALEDDTRHLWAERVVRAMNRIFPEVDFNTWPQCERLVRHTLAAVQVIQDLSLVLPEAGRLLNQCGDYLQDRARYAEAHLCYRHSLAIRELALGPEHPDIAQTLNNLAILHLAQGEYGEARPLLERSLVIREQALGPEHPEVARSLGHLANLYRDQEEFDQAEPLYERSLRIREQVLGPKHPLVAQSLNNFANLYRDQGFFARATPLYERSLKIREQVLGPDHPVVAQSLNNFANLHFDQGDFAEAEELYERSLRIREQALGPVHPDIATVLKNFAELLRAMGRAMEAAEMEVRAAAMQERHAENEARAGGSGRVEAQTGAVPGGPLSEASTAPPSPTG